MKISNARLILVCVFLIALLSAYLTKENSIPKNAAINQTSAKGIFVNPLFEGDFPDPHVIRTEKGWSVFATGNPGYYNIGVTSSEDFVNWGKVKEALPDRPSWQPLTQGLTWAPDVSKIGDEYLMFYVARDQDSGLQCLSRARSKSAEGPYIDKSEAPFFCQYELGGTIDPSLFVASNGERFLYFKNDGNAVGVKTSIWVARVDHKGDLISKPVDTGIINFRSWHGAVVEAPSVFEFEGKFFLTYSANDYNSEYYAIGWAISDSPLGPWSDKSIEPLLATKDQVAGPGGQQIFIDDSKNLWLAYHAWTYGKVGYGNGAGNARSFRVDQIEIKDGLLTSTGPTTVREKGPVTK